MPLFSRKKSAPMSSSPEPTVDDYIGRKFRSSLPLSACLEHFAVVKDQCYPTVGDLQDVEWRPPALPAVKKEFSDGPAEVPPARFVANDLADGGRIYLAIWEGTVSYGGSGQGGPPCEMWFVPPGFDNTPIPISGTWKTRDPSLSSVGLVEGVYWGG